MAFCERMADRRKSKTLFLLETLHDEPHYTKLNKEFLIDKRREQKAWNRECKTKVALKEKEVTEKLRERWRTNLRLPAEHWLLYIWSPQTEIVQGRGFKRD